MSVILPLPPVTEKHVEQPRKGGREIGMASRK